MSSKNIRILKKILPYIAVVFVACLIVVGVLVFVPKKQEPVPETTASEVIVETETETETTETEPEIPTVAAVDAIEVDKLIDRYYEAKINDNAEELNNIVDSDEEYDVAALADETQFINKYDNFKTYVMPGPEDDYFIVYVKYDIFFNGISTGAPALNHFLVRRDSDGYFCIYDKELSGEFETFMQETEESATVVNLKKQVEEELDEACEVNEDLKYLIQLLRGESETGDDGEPETEESSGESSENTDETDTSAESEETADGSGETDGGSEGTAADAGENASDSETAGAEADAGE